MNILSEQDLTPKERRELCLRPSGDSGEPVTAVREICLAVRQRGDDALREYGQRFDTIAVESFKTTKEEFEAARAIVPESILEALGVAAANIRTFHAAQGEPVRLVETMPGVVCWRERRPIETVGLYVPAGSAPLPSTVLMLGIPAVLAGCKRIVLCSPPKKNGSVDPMVLAAAELVGISEVYKVGGAQAIAALAYGTGSIPKVDKIFGPGNKYVTAAKRLVASDPEGAAIDLLAGPSELLIIANVDADPRMVAADLLSQAEHDPSSQVVLVTDSQQLADRVVPELRDMLLRLPRNEIARKALEVSFILVTSSLENAVRFSNEYAPEHLIVNVRTPERFVPMISNAGSVFLGPHAPVTAGDYASGTNHTLPTGGTARWSGGVSVESFQKTTTFQTISTDGIRNLAPTLTTLAEAEGLEGHKRAVTIRLNNP
ncbi:MAG: histidinol dehydrogenase [Bacteroidota bacterium]